MLPDNFKEDILFALSEIDRELAESELLFRLATLAPLDMIQTLAAAALLHGLYTGIEGILYRIHKTLYGRADSSIHWHRMLIDAVSRADSKNGPVLTEKTAENLRDYLAFRHRFRHSYGSTLDPMLVSAKLLQFPSVWAACKQEIIVFLENLYNR